MAILNNNPLVGASGNQGGYNINNSLRFRASASAYLSRTPASATNRKTWTWSGWVKKSNVTTYNTLFFANAGGNTNIQIQFLDDNTLRLFQQFSGVDSFVLVPTQVFRDPSAWYHIVVAVDTTQATSSNRAKMYINGQQVTAFSTATYPSLNLDTTINSTVAHYVGHSPSGPYYLDGYMAEVNFIDGSAKVASDFGETDTTTGVWKPKAYSGTYGTNGFYLKFSDIATTSGSNAGLGKDFSGNSNYWTTNNISVTSGTTYDAMTDSPTNTSATVGNYCTINPLLDLQTYATYSEANLKVSTTASAGFSMRMQSKGTMAIPSSGKWYFAANASDCGIGMANDDPNRTQYGPSISTTHVRYQSGGEVLLNGSVYATVASFTSTDEVGLAIDMDALTVGVYKNGSLLTTVTGVTSGFTYYPMTIGNSSATAYTAFWNFGQRPFAYTPPSGYKTLNTFNLPTPTILQGNKYMDAKLYTGNGTSQTITTAASFKPDLVWIKGRSYADFHTWFDTVRGATKSISSDLTTAEVTRGTALTAFTSTGFTVGSDTLVNYNGQTTVAWQWQAGQGSSSSNTSGSITSTVSVNTTAGFSIVTYTGNGSSPVTIGHGLGVAPKFIIIKDRSVASSWVVQHTSLGWTQGFLGITTAAASTSTLFSNNTAPTSSVFTVGGYSNNNAENYVAYCWAEIAGFSAFGSYTGNGSTDGTFVYTGFRPKFVVIKVSSTTNSWEIFDTSRDTYNASGLRLFAESSSAEVDSRPYIDILSNGFKLRSTGTGINGSGSTYIFMAFAENPFKNSLAR